jgi:hypothetical protein
MTEILPTTNSMTKTESWERFEEGMKKAISRANELGKSQKNTQWHEIAIGLSAMLKSGQTMYQRRALSYVDAMAMTDDIVDKMKKVN